MHLAITAGVDQASRHRLLWSLDFSLLILMLLVWRLSLFYRAFPIYFKLILFVGGGCLGGIDLHQHLHFATGHERWDIRLVIIIGNGYCLSLVDDLSAILEQEIAPLERLFDPLPIFVEQWLELVADLGFGLGSVDSFGASVMRAAALLVDWALGSSQSYRLSTKSQAFGTAGRTLMAAHHRPKLMRIMALLAN